jgi:phage protein D
VPANVYELSFDGSAADADLYGAVASIEVEETTAGSSFVLRLALEQDPGGQWPLLDDDRFAPFTRVGVSIGLPGASVEPVIEGYITDISVRIGAEPGDQQLEVRGSDLGVLLGIEEKVRAWPNVSDSDIAQQILSAYGCTVDAETTAPVRQENETLLVQRATDGDFLRALARRNGFELYASAGSSGVTCRFGPPKLDGQPQRDLAVRFGDGSNLVSFEVAVSGVRPLAVDATQLDAKTKQDGTASVTDSQLAPLGREQLEDVIGAKLDAAVSPLERQGRLLLLAQPTADATELQAVAQGVRDEAAWLIEARGEINAEAYGAVLRVGRLVLVKGAGRRYSGKYYVTRVAHRVAGDGSYSQSFEARRNARELDGSESFGSTNQSVATG